MPGPFDYTVCDVFTDKPLEGNQLGVFADGAGVPERLLQSIARELGFSETVFVFPPSGGGDARIRIFTPSREIPFAGHPVLGTAVVLGMRHAQDLIRLETGAGVVPVTLRHDAPNIAFGRMSQPLPKVEPFALTDALLAALGVSGSLLPVEIYDNGMKHVYVRLPDAAAVAGLEPDIGALARLASDLHFGTNCFAGSGLRWKTRMFAPADGVAEDPATGSAAGPLAAHLVRHGEVGAGEQIEIAQGAELGRPSTLFARASGSRERIESVEVAGSAIIVATGEFAW